MKKVMMLVAFLIGTTAMVSAQNQTQTTPAKEVKQPKAKKEKKAQKVEAMPAATATPAKATMPKK